MQTFSSCGETDLGIRFMHFVKLLLDFIRKRIYLLYNGCTVCSDMKQGAWLVAEFPEIRLNPKKPSPSIILSLSTTGSLSSEKRD